MHMQMTIEVTPSIKTKSQIDGKEIMAVYKSIVLSSF